MSTTLATASIPKTMAAIQKTKAEEGLWFHSGIEVPSIGPRDILVAVSHAGICGTDRHIYEWDQWSQSRVKVGISIGHEFVGTIAATGAAVTGFEIGQRVSAEGHIACGLCRMCRTGQAHICKDVKIIGIDRDGGFANYVSVPYENIWPIHDKISSEHAAIFDPLGNAVHTVMKAGVSGKDVLITGVGTIGLMAVMVARAAGAARIFVSDPDKQRVKMAIELGADEGFVSTEDWIDDLHRETDGYGVDVLLEISGHPSGIDQGFRALCPGGTAALLGIPAKPIQFEWTNHIIFKGAKILGINGREMFATWYQMEKLMLSGAINLDAIITHQLPMADFESGIKKMQSGEAIKVVLEIPNA